MSEAVYSDKDFGNKSEMRGKGKGLGERLDNKSNVTQTTHHIKIALLSTRRMGLKFRIHPKAFLDAPLHHLAPLEETLEAGELEPNRLQRL